MALDWSNLLKSKVSDRQLTVSVGKNELFCKIDLGIADRAFALKCIQKARVVQYGQQRHIMDEKNILVTIDSKFILRLHKTYKGKIPSSASWRKIPEK